MIASPNSGYFVYDGDDSDGDGRRARPGRLGRDREDVRATTSPARQVPTEGTDFDGRSDYGPVHRGRHPVGRHVHRRRGRQDGRAGRRCGAAPPGSAYDPCYHQACDNLHNIDRVALDATAAPSPTPRGVYATSTEDVNGVPPREARAEAMALAFSAFSIESADTTPYHGHLARS